MALADAFGHNLARGKVFNGRQIPDSVAIYDAAQVAAPHLMRVGDRPVGQQVAVAVMGGGESAVSASAVAGAGAG